MREQFCLIRLKFEYNLFSLKRNIFLNNCKFMSYCVLNFNRFFSKLIQCGATFKVSQNIKKNTKKKVHIGLEYSAF